MSYVNENLNQRVTANLLYGVHGKYPKAGYFKRCVGKLTPDGDLMPVKRYNMALSGGTAMGEDWYIKNFCLYIDGEDKGSVGLGDKVVVKFHDRHLVYPNRLRCTAGSALGSFNTPAFADACVFGNRVFGILDNTLYGSALGDETKWDDFENEDGSPKESGSFRVSIDEPFTAIAAFLDHVAVFTPNKLYLLYGSRPGNFTLNPVLNMGVRIHRELCINQNNLYFLNGGKLWHYSGGRAKDLLFDLQIDVSEKNWVLADNEGLYLAGRDSIDYFDGRYTTLYEDDCTGLFEFEGKIYAKIDMDMVQLQVGQRDLFYAVCPPPLNCGSTVRVIICAKGDVQILAGDTLLSRETSYTPSQREGYIKAQNGNLPDITLIGQSESVLYGVVFEGYGGVKYAAFTQQ